MLIKINKDTSYQILDEQTWEVWPAVKPTGPTVVTPTATITCTPMNDCFELTILKRDVVYRIMHYQQIFPNTTANIKTPEIEISVASDTDYIILNV